MTFDDRGAPQLAEHQMNVVLFYSLSVATL